MAADGGPAGPAGSGGQVLALIVEPGFAATGVNAQHNLAHSLFCVPRWLSLVAPPLLSTKFLHAVGCHASDGALPMVLAATSHDVQPNDWFTPVSRFAGEPIRADPSSHADAALDPLNERSTSSWPPESTEVFWEQAARWTGCANSRWSLA